MQKTYSIGILLILSFTLSLLEAQVYYDFEDDSANWQSAQSGLWDFSSEKAALGNNSLRYTISAPYTSNGIVSIETGYTISKVRTAHINGENIIIASSFEGTVLGLSYDGTILWKNELSGFYNHDVWCDDISGDGDDEILLANADGSIYCLNSKGEKLWDFRPNEAPMNAVTVVHKNNIPYVVCGGYDLCFYYLDTVGTQLKSVHSSTYSKEKSWGTGTVPDKYLHITNFIRPFKAENGDEHFVVIGSLNQNSASGGAYLFEPLANSPYQNIDYSSSSPIGDLSIVDYNGDGNDDFLLGTSNMINDSRFIGLDFTTEDTLIQKTFTPNDYNNSFDRFGYRVLQSRMIDDGGEEKLAALFGACMFIMDTDFSEDNLEVLTTKYAYNDLWQDDESGRLILASAQSGGSAIHVIDPSHANWKTAYQELTPPGKIASILDNTSIARAQLKNYDEANYPAPNSKIAYFMTESRTGVEDILDEAAQSEHLQFLNGYHVSHCEVWDRSNLSSELYQDKRDGRKKYDLTQQESLDMLLPLYDDTCGVAHWGGHGNDPMFFSLETRKKEIDYANGKKSVMIFPELEAHNDDFASVLEEHFRPLAEYAKGKNVNIFVRTKHLFWQSIAHMPLWELMQSGDYADVFVPAMEETTDKSMELSIASRMGFWMSGATDSWGARCARDNTSYNRLRQHSHQMLPNHFLRQMIYNVSSGAQYLNNFSVDQEYFSFLWELISSGALYIPQREDLLSISPVHLSMIEPDEYYLNEGNNAKWLTFYDKQKEEDNKLVFSHLNGTWPAAPVTEWDFSSYAAGEKERRLNYLPAYNNGLVLITPVEAPYFADNMGQRKKIAEQLHPIYRNIMTEYITDGRNYISQDSSSVYPAETYYTTIKQEIEEKAKLLPLTVDGDVAWVVAQTSPTHLRLTIIDGAYLNPSDKTAKINFHTVNPVTMKDMLDNSLFDINDTSNISVKIPCGLFRFIDIELSEAL